MNIIQYSVHHFSIKNFLRIYFICFLKLLSLNATSISQVRHKDLAKDSILSPDYTYKVLFVGDHGVGKTCLFNKIKDQVFLEYPGKTSAPDYAKHLIEINTKIVQLDMWDTAGEEQFSTLTRSAYHNVDTLVLCFDVTKKSSFESCKKRWLKEIEDNLEETKCLIICGTKCDVKDSQVLFKNDGDTLKTFFQRQNIFKDIYTVITSAKKDINVKQLVSTLGYCLLQYEPKKYANQEFKIGDHVILFDPPYRGKKAEIIETLETRFRVLLKDSSDRKIIIKENFNQIRLTRTRNTSTTENVSLDQIRPSSSGQSSSGGCCSLL